MKHIYKLLFLLSLPTLIFAQNKPISTAKPWAYWWWQGSAVSKEGIQQNLAAYQKAGFGGMHIIPIYGVKGEEKKNINFLSPQWFDMLDFTVKEAQKLGMGIDMTVGTGWPFGGSQVTDTDAAKSFKINEIDGKYSLEVVPTKQKVKRAAPGGEGWVVDHFSKTALQNYFKPFADNFTKKNYGVRAFYNDSYEVYGANWTTDFLSKFKTLRGYDLAQHLDVLSKSTAETDREKRIWSDYHETLSDLLRTEFTPSFQSFSKQFGKTTRNEAHGSPANILDLYAITDIPESEFFGSKPYDIPYYHQDPDYEESRFGRPDALVLKLASSPANILGKKLVASETATWLGNHFKVSLSQVKPIIDESFIGGVNHIFYHGVPYSPPNEPFPGWLFYASTNFNQNSHFWEQLPELNKYVERCQNLLQNTKSDNDLLVYLPIYDLWHTAGKNSKTHPIDVHNLLKGDLFNEKLQNTLKSLSNFGYSYDFISDLQLSKVTMDNEFEYLTEGKVNYKAIIVPNCTHMPLATLKKLNEFIQKGGRVYFTDNLPSKASGFQNWEAKQKEFDGIVAKLKPWLAENIIYTLMAKYFRKEAMADMGLSYIRKRTDRSTIYFVSNFSKNIVNQPVRLGCSGQSVQLYDPMTDANELVNFKNIGGKITEIRLNLWPGESTFIEVFDKSTLENPDFTSHASYNELLLMGNWNVNFTKGIPSLPTNYETNELKSWTTQSDSAAQFYWGKAKYSLNFTISSSATDKEAMIILGDVRDVAKVWLNGVEVGSTWSLPNKVMVKKGILKEQNTLEIEVANCSFNYVRHLDKTNVPWRKFYDINMVDINYKPFNAFTSKPAESGLLGPVRLWIRE